MKKTNLLLAVALAVFTLNAWADLCPKCNKMAFISSIGKCSKCENHTSSGAFKLCKQCSAKTDQCAHCEKPVVAKPIAAPPAGRKPYPKHWGNPPLRQTKDLRVLPGGYGAGSSTLASWIQKKLANDARNGIPAPPVLAPGFNPLLKPEAAPPDPVAPSFDPAAEANKNAKADLAKVQAGIKAWEVAKAKCKGNYSYKIGFESWVGFGHETTIVVGNNKVTERRYRTFNRRRPVAPPRPGLQAPQKAEGTSWVEQGKAIGNNKRGAPAKTLDELYVMALETAKKRLRHFERRHVRSDKQGLLISCYIMDRTIADDVPRKGLVISKITLAGKADDKPKKAFKAPNGKAFPAHWGAPPLRQTRDLRPLPGGYGRGSSTLRNWIQQNLDKDAKKNIGAVQIRPVPRPPIGLGLQAPAPNRLIPPPPRVVGRPAPTPVRELLAGDCAQCRTEAHQLHLGLAENGKTITVKVGSIVRVKLRGNPTTGFTWNNATPAGALKLMGKVTHQSGGRPGLLGAPGMSTATFATTKLGKGTIVLHYNRVFENNKVPAKTVKINIAVTKDGRAEPAKPTAGKNAARIAELEREIAKLKDFARRARFTPEGLKAHQAKITKLEQELSTLTAGKIGGAPTFETWVKGGMKIPRGRAFIGGSPWFDERKGERRSPREVYKMLYGGKKPPVIKPRPRPNPGKGRFPAHWGAPPRLQTRDLRPLPGGYGRGSSTLARWIQQNLDKDKANPNRGKGNKDPKGNVLPKKLSLKDAQGGFAGFTGWETTINVDGSWNRRQFFNQQLRPIEKQGKLTDAQANAIKAAINAAHIEKLPARLGTFRGANPHVLTLTFGDNQIAFTLPTAAKLEKPQPGGKLTGADAFALVAHELANLHKNAGAPKPRIRPLPGFPPGALGKPAPQPRR